MVRGSRLKSNANTGEFLWLISLSDLMILLFVFFVVLFSFAYQKLGHADFRRMSAILKDEPPTATPLDEVHATLQNWVIDRNLMESVSVKQREDSLVLQIKEKLLFNSGEYALKGEDGRNLLKMIAIALEKVPAPYRIGIEGHTDDIPIHTNYVVDNWDLSAKRAHTVLTALNLSAGQKQRAVIMGYGDQQPIFQNRNTDGKPIRENQLKNRRVTIRIF